MLFYCSGWCALLAEMVAIELGLSMTTQELSENLSFRADILKNVVVFERGVHTYLGGFQRNAFQKGIELLEFDFKGDMKSEDSTPSRAITEFMRAHSMNLISTHYAVQTYDPNKVEDWENITFFGTYMGVFGYCETSRVRYKSASKDLLTISMVLTREYAEKSNIVGHVQDLFCERHAEKVPSSRLYTLAQGNNGIDFLELKNVSREFQPSNYPSEVVCGFESMVQNIESKAPAGRLYILSGFPGTGKTFFFRGLIHRMQQVQFVLVDPAVLAQISQPQLIRTFMQFTSQKFATVLLVEDADSCLVQRMSDNMSYISSLLNLTDGIYGDAFNIHVLASTNQDNIHIDDALKRTGRLHQSLDFRPLTQEEARHIYKREVGHFPQEPFETISKKSSLGLQKGFTDTPSITIAEVYRHVRMARPSEKAIEPTRKEERTIEFMRF